jgi:uncharacterized membrane protein
MESIWNLIIYFAICSFIGWIIQAISDLFQKKKITNTGFLYGPFIPLFGFTAIMVYFFNLFFEYLPLRVKLICFFILPLGIEYFTGFLLEKIFRVKLWDYSHQKLNFKGRISLAVGIVWFLLILFQVFILQEIIFEGINYFNETIRIIFALTFLIYFTVDFVFSTKMFYYFSKLKKEIERKGENFNLNELNKRIISKIKTILRKAKMSPAFKKNFDKGLEGFFEKFNKNKKK